MGDEAPRPSIMPRRLPAELVRVDVDAVPVRSRAHESDEALVARVTADILKTCRVLAVDLPEGGQEVVVRRNGGESVVGLQAVAAYIGSCSSALRRGLRRQLVAELWPHAEERVSPLETHPMREVFERGERWHLDSPDGPILCNAEAAAVVDLDGAREKFLALVGGRVAKQRSGRHIAAVLALGSPAYPHVKGGKNTLVVPRRGVGLTRVAFVDAHPRGRAVFAFEVRSTGGLHNYTEVSTPDPSIFPRLTIVGGDTNCVVSV